MGRRVFAYVFAVLLTAVPVSAATISGLVSDATGAALPATRIVLRDVAAGRELVTETGVDGRYKIAAPAPGTYLIIVARPGFAEAARTVRIERADQEVDVPVQLVIGVLNAEVSVTASRAEREIREIPLHVETRTGDALGQTNPLSTGDALAGVVNITPVGSGPFGVRPRLRGLDSTRLLVLVDGERLNTARQATDRTGAEVGLVPPDTINRLEIVNGAGTLMYGSDALAGTINIITNEPSFSASRRFLYGLNSFYSTNENGRRGSLTLGVTSPRYAVRIQGGVERFDNYRTGAFDTEDTRPLFASGALHRADTIDDAFGFVFRAFPDPFNAPYVRTDDEVLNSQAKGHFANASALVSLGARQTLRLRYQRRLMKNIGFPDFAQPYFFNATSLPHSRLDRASVRYEMQGVTSWLANLTATAYYQQTERLLLNLLPVQFPVPTATTLFPINVMRLDLRSETEQRVWTPGAAVQATLVPKPNHLVTAGLTLYRDRSSDQRTTTTTTSMVGRVTLGARGPAPEVFPSPIQLGAPVSANPVRVPDASLRDVGLFVQDEWRIMRKLSLVGGIRGDFYNVTTEATPGYEVSSLVAGAVPVIDPRTLPDPAGATYTRRALTGDVGLIANRGGRINPFLRVGRSYRHPNLEEMLFAGPATVGNIAPNVTVQPEVGTNFDAGAKFRAGQVSGGAYVFVNQYENFIAQDVFVATTAARTPLAQALNYADVRISGVEVTADAPIVLRQGVLTLAAAGAYTRGTIRRAATPGGIALAGTPADNITPLKLIASARFTEPRGRWWVEYGVRSQSKVKRVARTLLESPFLIAQDLLSLDGFAVQRLGWGVQLARRDRMGLTFAVENVTNEYYREHFQFAPARGRSFTAGFTIGGF
jgi:outer membrane receptor protein involved in Fe transport